MHRPSGGIDVVNSTILSLTIFLGQGKAMGIDDERYTSWNAELLRQAKDFATDASKASIFVVSSYAIISDMLDDPETYGLSECIEEDGSNSEKEDEEESDDNDDDGQKAMWVDDIHLSTAGHRAFANRLWTIFQD
jgi:phospholipase/lecithinase/hemolysin